ncbi:hypothetical protein A2U01_0105094 [Trifolium medium]|uniref:Uncharacterized protein n=1 Tax=Trifolium medium TaxID=97028 RepID=A0A392V663_9FABA|nr:hypothetical protein [Trifolium medium]
MLRSASLTASEFASSAPKDLGWF